MGLIDRNETSVLHLKGVKIVSMWALSLYMYQFHMQPYFKLHG